MRRKGFLHKKEAKIIFLKKTVPFGENENDKYYNYKKSSGYATLSKMLNCHGLIAGSTGTGKPDPKSHN